MPDEITQPARTLEQALRAMTFEVLDERFALCGFDEPPVTADLTDLRGAPGQLTCEGGETSVLLEQSKLPAFLARHPDARVEHDLLWIRFRSAMGWEVVGFLARVTGALAGAGIPLGAVCGFSRDHLFVHEKYLPQSLAVLRELFPTATPN